MTKGAGRPSDPWFSRPTLDRSSTPSSRIRRRGAYGVLAWHRIPERHPRVVSAQGVITGPNSLPSRVLLPVDTGIAEPSFALGHTSLVPPGKQIVPKKVLKICYVVTCIVFRKRFYPLTIWASRFATSSSVPLMTSFFLSGERILTSPVTSVRDPSRPTSAGAKPRS